MLRRSREPRDFLVADSPAMRGVVEAVGRFAESDAPVLICGEHGTGRELVARVLHQAGPRRDARFVAVRPTLDGPDVPGPEAGGKKDEAEQRARRALRAAAGGTLLIKDVVDLPAGSQRTLRKAMRRRDGSPERADRPERGERAEPARRRVESTGEVFDVRVVGSADADLENAVQAKILSRELYEQLVGQRIDVPPLRERVADIPVLFERWVRHYGDEVGRGKLSVSTRAHARLVKYPWPGNVAELKAIARRLVVRASGPRVEAGDVDEILPKVAERVPLEDMAFEDMIKAKLAGFMQRMDGYPVHDLYEKVVQRVERPLFELVLQQTGGNQLKAAEILGLNRNTLRKKLVELGLEGSTRRRKRAKDREDQALD
ncbi:MAG: sigma-54-dependent Fis family transcriptional regulator [Kofleriaceae bacterium]|nr:sigma-54-dependent Fis family transcriptional regulator [Kofleriaceae bacterium]